MGGIWLDAGSGWEPLAPVGFPLEKNLHDTIEQAPAMLPLPGQPRLVVLGREVTCRGESADLVAVDAVSGQPVVIEIKLASNTDRRRVVTQVLGYAAFLHRLSVSEFEALLSVQLAKQGHASVVDAVMAAVQDDSIDQTVFVEVLQNALTAGRLRCVIVIDTAPPDLVELVGYLHTVTNDRLEIDLVTVSGYEVAGKQVLVPQLVEPHRTPPPQLAATAKIGGTAPVKGGQVFAESIEQSDPATRDALRHVYNWARRLEQDQLAVLYTSTGKGRWVLNPRLPGQERGLLSIFNEHGVQLCPYRTVLGAEAPDALTRLDARLPDEIRQGNYIKAEVTDDILDLFREAYQEASMSNAPHGPQR